MLSSIKGHPQIVVTVKLCDEINSIYDVYHRNEANSTVAKKCPKWGVHGLFTSLIPQFDFKVQRLIWRPEAQFKNLIWGSTPNFSGLKLTSKLDILFPNLNYRHTFALKFHWEKLVYSAANYFHAKGAVIIPLLMQYTYNWCWNALLQFQGSFFHPTTGKMYPLLPSDEAQSWQNRYTSQATGPEWRNRFTTRMLRTGNMWLRTGHMRLIFLEGHGQQQ